MQITAQVAAITKPLAAANEMVDADNLVIMHKEGGVIQKLDQKDKDTIMNILEKSKGPKVPILRKAGAFVIEVEVKEDEEGFRAPRKTVKPKEIKPTNMEIDEIVKGAWEAFWECRDCEEESGFHRQESENLERGGIPIP